MKVAAFNGSARKDGNTAILIGRVFAELEKAGIETELVQLAGQTIRGCTACMKCVEKLDRRCVNENDIVIEFPQIFVCLYSLHSFGESEKVDEGEKPIFQISAGNLRSHVVPPTPSSDSPPARPNHHATIDAARSVAAAHDPEKRVLHPRESHRPSV